MDQQYNIRYPRSGMTPPYITNIYAANDTKRDGTEEIELERNVLHEDRFSLIYSEDVEESGLHRPMLMFTDDPQLEHAPLDGDITKEDIIDWLISVLCGLVIGFAMVKSLCFLPTVLHYQFQFRHWQLLKMLVAACATLLIGSLLLSRTKKDFQARRYGTKGFLSAGIGGALLGAGIALCGCTPGLEWIQVGAGVWHMGFVALGALIGAILYSLLEEYISKPLREQANPEKPNVDGMLDTDFWKVAAPFAAFLLLVTIMFEMGVPFNKDMPEKPYVGVRASQRWFEDVHGIWPPYVAGIFIGLMAICLRSSYAAHMSFHDVYTTTCGMIVRPIMGDKTPEDLKAATHKSFLNEYWLLAGTALGAYLAAEVATDPSIFQLTNGPKWYWCLSGGAIAMIGARMTGGDLLSHSVAGVGDLNVTSLTASGCIFLGGFGTTLLMKIMRWEPFR